MYYQAPGNTTSSNPFTLDSTHFNSFSNFNIMLICFFNFFKLFIKNRNFSYYSILHPNQRIHHISTNNTINTINNVNSVKSSVNTVNIINNVNNVKNCNTPGISIFLSDRVQYSCFTGVNVLIRRFYRPERNIDWVGIRRKWRIKEVLMAKKKHKNHPRVAMRFRLTRFGWERLQSGRNARKLHLSRLKYKNKKRIKYVSRSDLKKLEKQMPGHRLRIRDPPVNNNPNIRNVRKVINSYFG